MPDNVGTTVASVFGPRFKQRFVAWWRGYDQPPRPTGSGSAKSRFSAVADKLDAFAPPDRIAAMQALWGEGFCTPGNADFVVHLAKPLRLSSELSLLDVGAGLGGPDRELAKAFGVWVTGMETDRDLIAAGAQIAKQAGLGKKAELVPFDIEKTELPERKYDRIFSKEFLSTVNGKENLVKKLVKSLRAKGEALVTDFVLGPADAAAAQVAEWSEHEPAPRHFWPPHAMVECFKVGGLEVRIADDMTDAYLEVVFNEFRRLEKALREDGTLAVSEALSREVNLWLGRVDLLQAKALRIFRFHALKANAPKTMSDW